MSYLDYLNKRGGNGAPTDFSDSGNTVRSGAVSVDPRLAGIDKELQRLGGNTAFKGSMQGGKWVYADANERPVFGQGRFVRGATEIVNETDFGAGKRAERAGKLYDLEANYTKSLISAQDAVNAADDSNIAQVNAHRAEWDKQFKENAAKGWGTRFVEQGGLGYLAAFAGFALTGGLAGGAIAAGGGLAESLGSMGFAAVDAVPGAAAVIDTAASFSAAELAATYAGGSAVYRGLSSASPVDMGGGNAASVLGRGRMDNEPVKAASTQLPEEKAQEVVFASMPVTGGGGGASVNTAFSGLSDKLPDGSRLDESRGGISAAAVEAKIFEGFI